MTAEFVSNYEVQKLTVHNPTILNVLILIIFGIGLLVSLKKSEIEFLGREQTNQLKGLAILLVVTGHLWMHVTSEKAIPILGDYGVSAFLMLSGYGLTRSSRKKTVRFASFARRRLVRVILPYWIITTSIVILDWVILDRSHSACTLISSMLCVNVAEDARHLDYTRWYITILLANYVGFYVSYRYVRGRASLVAIWLVGFLMLIARVTKLFPLGAAHQLVAFPMGCALAHYLPEIRRFIREGRTKYRLLLVLAIASIGLSVSLLFREMLPKIASVCIDSVNALVFCCLLVVASAVMSGMSVNSRLLLFVGTISYELYLIHGPIMIKYNPVFGHLGHANVVVGYLLLLVLMVVMSYGMRRFDEMAARRWT